MSKILSGFAGMSDTLLKKALASADTAAKKAGSNISSAATKSITDDIAAKVAKAAGKAATGAIDDIAAKAGKAATGAIDDIATKAGKAATGAVDDIATKAGKAATGAVDDVAAKAGKAATESVDDIGKKVGKAATESADDIGKKAGKAATESADDIGKKAGKAATESADDVGKKAGKAATESADDVGKKAGKAATESADDVGKKAGKAGAESADDLAKAGSKSFGKKLKKGALGLAGLAAIGLTAYEAQRVMEKSKELFDKRNLKQFQVTKVTSTTKEMTITFDNPDNLKIYPEEFVELMNVFPQVNDKYTVIKQVDNTTVTVVYAKAVYNNSDIKAGTMKLYADQTNDANQVLKDDFNTVVDAVGDALKTGICGFISMFSLEPYVDTGMNVGYAIFFIIILMILMKVLQLVSLLLGEHIAVKLVSGGITLGILYGVHVYAGPYFVLKC